MNHDLGMLDSGKVAMLQVKYILSNMGILIVM